MPYFSNHPAPTPPLNLPLPSTCKAEQEKAIRAGVLGKRKLGTGFRIGSKFLRNGDFSLKDGICFNLTIEDLFQFLNLQLSDHLAKRLFV